MKWIFYILLIASGIALLLPLPGAAATVCGLVQAFFVPGFVFLLYLGDRERSPLDTLYFTPLISPLILTFLVLALYGLTASVYSATRFALGILYVFLVISPFVIRRREMDNGNTVPSGIVWISAAFGALFVLTFIVNDYLFAYDMVWHSAIPNEILYRGIPPLIPFFPDMPMQSNWFAYVFMAALKSLTDLSMIHAMWVFSFFSIFIFPYLIARITRCITNRRVYLLAIPLFAITGLAVAGWITVPLNLMRALVGDVRGGAEIARIMSQVELNGRGVVKFLAPFAGYPVNILSQYILIDVHHYALNLVLLFMIVTFSGNFQHTSHWRAAVMTFIIMIGTFLFHVLTGAFFLIAAVISAPVVLVRAYAARRAKQSLFHTVTIPCCAVAAAAIVLPYFASFRGTIADGIFIPDRIALSLYNLMTIAVSLAVLIPFSWRALRGILRGDDAGRAAVLGTWVLSFFIVSIAFDLRGTMESMAVFPLMALLSVPIGIQIVDSLGASRGVRRGLLVLWIAVLFLAPAVLTVRGLMLDKPKVAHEIRRYRITDDERLVYEWIRNNTDIGDVIIEKNEYNVMPYYAFRRNFYMASKEIKNYGYRGKKVERYRAIRDELYGAFPVRKETIDRLRSFDFGLYLVLWREDIENDPSLKTRFDAYPEWFTTVYRNRDGIVYRLRR